MQPVCNVPVQFHPPNEISEVIRCDEVSIMHATLCPSHFSNKTKAENLASF